MKDLKKYFIVLFLFSAVLFNIFPINVYGVSEVSVEQAESRIKVAEEALESAYLAVSDVEGVGGDVSQLVLSFNQELEWMSEAKNALTQGEYDNAFLLAETVLGNATYTENQAHSLESFTTYNAEAGFRKQFITFIVSIGLIFGVEFFLWTYIKKYYVRKMMELKPEVSSREYG